MSASTISLLARIIASTLIIFSFFFRISFNISPVLAHPGNTDSSGCHTCRTNCPSWGLSYGEYHCHTPKIYTPQSVYVPPVIYTFPQMNATWKWTANHESETYNLSVDLQDSNPSKYSITLNKCMGCDPGPLIDYDRPNFYFQNVLPGRWYMNIKKEINGYWSTIAYWTIDIPSWSPPPSPTIITTPIKETKSGSDSEAALGIFGLIGTSIFVLHRAINQKWPFHGHA